MKTYSSEPSPEKHFERAVVLFNPNKSATPRFENAMQQVHFLSKDHCLPITELETSADKTETQQDITENVRGSDLLIIVGGDGSTNIAVQAILQTEKVDDRPTTLIVPAGSANDFARNHNGKLGHRKERLSNIFAHCRVAEIHPLSLVVERPSADQIDSYIAVNNAGFGYTAKLAYMINQTEHRDSWIREMPVVGYFAQDMVTGFKSLQGLNAIPFFEGSDDSPKDLADRSFVHARIAGKYGHYDTSHYDTEFVDALVATATKRAILTEAGFTMIGIGTGIRTSMASFTIGDQPTIGHVDGETFPVEANSSVVVRLSEQAFKTLTTRPH